MSEHFSSDEFQWTTPVSTSQSPVLPPLPAEATGEITISDFQLNEDGWGSRFQPYPWSMEVFQGQLYVGTAHIDAFVRLAPQTGASQVQVYDGTEWTQSGADGFGDLENNGIRIMEVFDDALYAATFNREGAEIWRTYDGETWEQVVDDGFGEQSNISIRALYEYDGYLYAGVQSGENALTGELWRSENGTDWEEVEIFGFGGFRNSSVHYLLEFDDHLYAVTRNIFSGSNVYRSEDGLDWERVVGGFGNEPSGFGDRDNGAILHMVEFNGELYLSTLNIPDGFGLYKTSDGETFEQVGLNGFGDDTAVYGWYMIEFDGALYLGVANGDDDEGAELWRTYDGETFEQVIGDEGFLADYGLNDINYWGIRTMAVYDDMLIIGAASYPYPDDPSGFVGARVFGFTSDILDGHLPVDEFVF